MTGDVQLTVPVPGPEAGPLPVTMTSAHVTSSFCLLIVTAQ